MLLCGLGRIILHGRSEATFLLFGLVVLAVFGGAVHVLRRISASMERSA